MDKMYWDMDGTLARFYEKSTCLEDMYKEGFFRSLNPYEKAISLFRAKREAENYILSACVDTPYCRQEKINWIKQYLPEVPESRIILVNVGEDKSKYVDDIKNAILVDDHTPNLLKWEIAGGLGIKAMNEINGIVGRWEGMRISVI